VELAENLQEVLGRVHGPEQREVKVQAGEVIPVVQQLLLFYLKQNVCNDDFDTNVDKLSENVFRSGIHNSYWTKI
jgi:hypothetical protein